MHNQAPEELFLVALLWQLKADFATFLEVPGGHNEAEEAALTQMKRSAYALYQGIQAACRRGKTVLLQSRRRSGGRHTIRSPGPLNPDGITMRYSSERNATSYFQMCAFLSSEQIVVQPGARDRPASLTAAENRDLLWSGSREM